MRRALRALRSAVAGPLLIVLVGFIGFSAGWVSGKSGSYVSGLLVALGAKKEIERNLDDALKVIGSTKDEASRLINEKLDLESKVRSLEERIRGAASKPKAAPAPKPKPAPVQVKPQIKITPSARCGLLWPRECK